MLSWSYIFEILFFEKVGSWRQHNIVFSWPYCYWTFAILQNEQKASQVCRKPHNYATFATLTVFKKETAEAKKKKFYVSKLTRNWKGDSKCVFLFFFKFFLAWADVPNLSRSQPVFSMKYGTWFLDEQDTRQSTKLKQYVVQSVLLCLSYLFMYILTRNCIKQWKKKTFQAKKN